jgi:CRISPR-associated protein Csm5
MTLKTTYNATISLLTPLHIGSGAELRRDYDYVTHGRQTWMMDADAFLEDIYWKDGKFDDRIIGRPASELLQPTDFQPDSRYFRYVIPGVPKAEGHGAVVREQLKDVFDRPYLPGSSIKGALRTVLMWHGFQAMKQRLDVGVLSGSRSWAAQPIEREILGRNPNYDLLRALQVADSAPQTQNRLQLVNAKVFTGSEKTGAPIELEAIRSDTAFKTTFTIDEYLHSESAERTLKFGNRWSWLTELPEIARRHAIERTRAEMQWYRERKYDQVAAFYGQMFEALRSGALGQNSFIIQIGWGGGWAAKTIGSPLQSDTTAWERLLNDKRLSPSRFRRRAGDAFPKSRRSVTVNDKPVAPFGWCIVEMAQTI